MTNLSLVITVLPNSLDIFKLLDIHEYSDEGILFVVLVESYHCWSPKIN